MRELAALLILLVSTLLAACAATPVRMDDVDIGPDQGLQVPIDAHLVVSMSPEERARIHTTKLLGTFHLTEGVLIENAARKVFGKAFKRVSVSTDTARGDLIASISGQTHVDTLWGRYKAKASTQVTSPDGRVFGHYRAKGVGKSDFINDNVALENAYIRAFTAVVDQMLTDPVLTAYLGDERASVQPRVELGRPVAEPQEKPVQPIEGQRLALVIGNANYKSAPLRNPVNDARDMAATLRRLGFEVLYRENAVQRTMEEVIRVFGRGLRQGGVGLFYFAGHGVQVRGRNYLVPVDATIEKETDVKYEAVDANRVLDEMYEAENGLNLVFLDACRDNPYVRSFRSTSRGLARMDAPTGTFIAFATAPGSVAEDGRDRNGIFTGHLLQNMDTPGLKIEEVLKKVRIGVMRDTGKRQVPWESSSLTGDFYFLSP